MAQDGRHRRERWSVGIRVRGWVAAACFALLGTGCFDAPDEARERLARVKAQGEEMDRALEGVEERLLGNQAMVHLWQEMGRRHEQVSALACENVSGHVQQMAKHLDEQQARTRRVRQARSRGKAETFSAAARLTKTRSN
jgi:hypothetical protein